MKQEFVEFYGTQLLVINNGGEPMVSLRHLCDGIGLHVSAQREKVQSNPTFTWADIRSTGLDGKTYEMVCIPLSQVNYYLSTINPNKVRADLRDNLIKYQVECAHVLYAYFSQKQPGNDFEGVVTSALRSMEQRMIQDKAEIMSVCRGLRDDVDELQMALTCLIDDKEHDIIRKELKKTKEYLKIDGRTLAGKIRGMLGISTYKAPMAGKRIINCCKNLRGEGLKVVEDENRNC